MTNVIAPGACGVAIGVPRNGAIAANQDPSWFDMGLCGPMRTDHLPPTAGAADTFCGMTYGLITTQYVGGTVQKFNDLPPAYRANIDTQMPMDGRAPGSAHPMSEQDVADLVCFRCTSNTATAPASSIRCRCTRLRR
jgi:hypothetical protein